MKLREKVWLWGQTPGSHHESGVYNLTGENKMGPVEGAKYFGIDKIFRVKMSKDVNLSFTEEMENLKDIGSVMLSGIGSGGCSNNEDTDEIVALAKKYKNLLGAIMDDFVSESRLALFTPEKLAQMRKKLNNAVPGRKLEFWTVIYERDFDKDIRANIQEFDNVTFWTWYGNNLTNYNQNFDTIKGLLKDGQKLMLGVYMYDYGDGHPLSDELMQYQLDFVLSKLKAKEIDGIVICSNCIADIGLKAVEIMLEWLNKYGELEI